MVRASYPGASAETIQKSVIVPLEQAINGVEDMTYMTSSAALGSASVTVYFRQGTDPDMAAVNVQNKVSRATGQLPSEVTQIGVTTMKRQTSMVKIFSLYSPDDTYDETFLSNYSKINIEPRILRIAGVGEAFTLGADYSMRIWLKPDVMAQYKLIPSDVTAALEQAHPDRKWYLHVARIYRDARRLHGSGPYKENLWFTLRCDSSRGPEIPAFYFEITPHNYSYGMGFYWAKANTMACFRRAIDADPLPLTALAEQLNAQDTFVLTGQDYARAKGDPGTLLRPWYNKRVLDLSCVREHDDLLFSPALTEELVRGFGFLLPYYDYLEAVTRREDA